MHMIEVLARLYLIDPQYKKSS
ncbi:Protein of unknown function [Bacillus cytotoxicus]|nr:Protein of unknown function [Bacillus cytotoxicus]